MYFYIVMIAGLTALAVSNSPPATQPAAKVVELAGDVRINAPVKWRDAHYQIRGNLILENGGELSVDHCTIEIMNDYARQFNIEWQGGRLITRHSTLGGTRQEGTVRQCNFELRHGEWTCEDTTVRYSYGIVFGGSGQVSKLRAKRLMQGPNPDAIIMNGTGEAIVEDSTFNIALNVGAGQGGNGIFDFPTDKPVTTVYDHRNVPGAQYRLQLVNTRVPGWFLFVSGISMEGPPVEIRLQHAPLFIPAISGSNITGELRLPHPWPPPGTDQPKTLKTGNVTWIARAQDVHIVGWAAYFSGPKTNVTLRGPTNIAELMLWQGRMEFLGTPGTFDAVTSATTIEIGWRANSPPPAGKPPAELVIRNAKVGRFDQQSGVRGQITAHGGSRISIENAQCGNLLLMTKDDSKIELRDIQRQGHLETRAEGGDIRFLDESATTAAP